MSDSKPCPVEALTAISTGKLAKQLCATCPNRAPSAVEQELRDCLRDVMEMVMLWPGHPLRVRASALLAKNQVGQPDGRS